VHEHPCCRNSTFNHTPETHLFNTLPLVNVSDDLLGNWTHDCVAGVVIECAVFAWDQFSLIPRQEVRSVTA